MKKLDTQYHIFGSGSHKYEINPRLNEQEISLFETQNRIKLPLDYRLYLTNIGDGGAGPFYGLNKLTDNDCKTLDLTQSFIYSYNHPLSLHKLYEETLDELSEEEHEAKLELIYQQANQGIIFLSTEGCGMYSVLVVNGEAYGSVWFYDFSNDVGIYPLTNPKNKQPMQFLDWFEVWLDRSLDQTKLLSYTEFIS